MALKQYFNIVLVPLKFIPKRTASFWQTIKIPNRFVLKICTGGFADYRYCRLQITRVVPQSGTFRFPYVHTLHEIQTKRPFPS